MKPWMTIVFAIVFVLFVPPHRTGPITTTPPTETEVVILWHIVKSPQEIATTDLVAAELSTLLLAPVSISSAEKFIYCPLMPLKWRITVAQDIPTQGRWWLCRW